MAISHEQAQVRGRIGGLTKAARATDPRDLTRAANAARWQKYLNMVPAEITDPADRQRRAELFRSADMARLALRSSMVRSRAAKLRRGSRAGRRRSGRGRVARRARAHPRCARQPGRKWLPVSRRRPKPPELPPRHSRRLAVKVVCSDRGQHGRIVLHHLHDTRDVLLDEDVMWPGRKAVRAAGRTKAGRG